MSVVPISIIPTMRCTNKCPQCYNFYQYFDYKDVPDLTLQQIEKLLDNYRASSPVFITGGEPRNHPQYKEIVELCSRKATDKRRIVIQTSGHQAKGEFTLVRNNPYITISFIPPKIKSHRLVSKPPVEYGQITTSKRCRFKQQYGIAFNGLGKYPCTPSIALERLLKRKIQDIENDVCRHCHFSLHGVKYNGIYLPLITDEEKETEYYLSPATICYDRPSACVSHKTSMQREFVNNRNLALQQLKVNK